MLAENAAFVQALLVEHAGVCFSGEQEHVLCSRLASLAKHRNLASADALVSSLRLAPSGALLDSVIEALTTHETSFFRDPSTFKALGASLLPTLIERRAHRRSLCIWSAGCSTGQEPYSLAILLREHFPELSTWRVRILATDVSRSIVERARAGRFSMLELKRGLTDAARDKYFVADGSAHRVVDEVRGMVSWEVMNLTATWPPLPAFDLILMRNVLIYFSPEARAVTLGRVAAHLASDGYLALGASETTFGASEALVPTVASGATFYRKVKG
jgi:chemotaxis protein methyltransferase CheR